MLISKLVLASRVLHIRWKSVMFRGEYKAWPLLPDNQSAQVKYYLIEGA